MSRGERDELLIPPFFYFINLSNVICKHKTARNERTRQAMKGRNTFTKNEIAELERLIVLRTKTPASGQKAIRQKMRNIGFYGQDDWGITNLQPADLKTLISSGRIKVSGKDTKTVSLPKAIVKVQKITKPETLTTRTKATNLNSILESFKLNRFDPQLDSETKIHNSSGNYIICLRKNSKLPTVSITPTLTTYEGLKVIYTGIAGGSLRTRDYRQHFKGNNAGRSTLRKSLGVLFLYKQIARDKSPNNNKTKFNATDEQTLTEWMHTNLIMYFLPTDDFDNIEIKLINNFNPPLNLKDNHNSINADFRQLLSSLRANKN